MTATQEKAGARLSQDKLVSETLAHYQTCKHGSGNICCAQCDKDLCDWYDYSPAEADKRLVLREVIARDTPEEEQS